MNNICPYTFPECCVCYFNFRYSIHNVFLNKPKQIKLIKSFHSCREFFEELVSPNVHYHDRYDLVLYSWDSGNELGLLDSSLIFSSFSQQKLSFPANILFLIDTKCFHKQAYNPDHTLIGRFSDSRSSLKLRPALSALLSRESPLGFLLSWLAWTPSSLVSGTVWTLDSDSLLLVPPAPPS